MSVRMLGGSFMLQVSLEPGDQAEPPEILWICMHDGLLFWPLLPFSLMGCGHFQFHYLCGRLF